MPMLRQIHIDQNPAVMGGKPVLQGARVTAALVPLTSGD